MTSNGALVISMLIGIPLALALVGSKSKAFSISGLFCAGQEGPDDFGSEPGGQAEEEAEAALMLSGVLAAIRYRWIELLLLAGLTVLAVRLSPAWWLAVAGVAWACGRQEWRTHRLPTEPVSTPAGPSVAVDEDRAGHG